VWSVDGSGEPRVFRGHGGLTDVRGDRTFTPHGRRFVSSSSDGTLRVWSTDGSSEPLVFQVSDKGVNSASWSPDGRRIVAASDDRTVSVWSDIEALHGPDDPRLWRATTYCPPLDVRRRLLDFPEAQSLEDMERCQRRVSEAR
jgi:WD40 repeat protein